MKETRGSLSISDSRPSPASGSTVVDETRWDEKAGLRRDAVRSQVIDVLSAQEIKETGNEEGWHRSGESEQEFLPIQVDHRPGPRRSLHLVLRVGRSGCRTAGTEAEHDSKGHARNIRGNAAQSPIYTSGLTSPNNVVA
jgi:hypothetical protein